MDAKLEKLLEQGTQAEIQARLERVLRRRDDLATDNYVRYCIRVAAKNGYGLVRGDVALVHPADLPETVQLVPRRDPVYAIQHPEVVKGLMLFVRKPQVEKYLKSALAVH